MLEYPECLQDQNLLECWDYGCGIYSEDKSNGYGLILVSTEKPKHSQILLKPTTM